MNKKLLISVGCFASLLIVNTCSSVKSQTQNKRLSSVSAIPVSIKAPLDIEMNEESYVDFYVQRTRLRLVNRDGRCTLLYKSEDGRKPPREESLDMDMTAPCNFARAGKDYLPKYFIYGTGADERAAMLVVGGPPSKEFPVSDRFMPNGCGTWLTKIYVYEGRVKIAWSGDNGTPGCPTSGRDEIEFAS